MKKILAIVFMVLCLSMSCALLTSCGSSDDKTNTLGIGQKMGIASQPDNYYLQCGKCPGGTGSKCSSRFEDGNRVFYGTIAGEYKINLGYMPSGWFASFKTVSTYNITVVDHAISELTFPETLNLGPTQESYINSFLTVQPSTYNRNNAITYEIIGANDIDAKIIDENKIYADKEGQVAVRAKSSNVVSNEMILTFTNAQITGIPISNAIELSNIRHNLSGNYKLIGNIELTENWIPIGDKNNPFVGQFNGANYKIKGLTIDSMSLNGIGLFGAVGQGGSVSNLVLEDVNIFGSYAGGITGFNSGSITRCTVESGIIGNQNYTFYNGGIAGETSSGISFCENTATIRAQSFAGGIAGQVLNSSLISNNNLGQVTASNYAGGIAGRNQGSNNYTGNINAGNIAGVDYIGGIFGESSGTLTDNRNEGTISAAGINTGGLVGRMMGGSIAANANLGSVTGGNNVGGIVGLIESGTAIGAVTNSGAVVGIDYVGGYFGKITGSTSISNLSNATNVVGRNYVGGILGEASGSIVACNNAASVNIVSTGSYVGGIAGASGAISECVNNGSITILSNSAIVNDFIGGIVGRASGAVSDNTNNANIIISIVSNHVGGISGQVVGSLANCRNYGKIESAGDKVGGIAGSASNSAVNNCINYSAATIKGNNRVGGIVGDITNSSNQNVTACRNAAVITGMGDYIAGIFGSATRINISSSENEGNILGNNYLAGLIGFGATVTSGAGLANTGTIAVAANRNEIMNI